MRTTFKKIPTLTIGMIFSSMIWVTIQAEDKTGKTENSFFTESDTKAFKPYESDDWREADDFFMRLVAADRLEELNKELDDLRFKDPKAFSQAWDETLLFIAGKNPQQILDDLENRRQGLLDNLMDNYSQNSGQNDRVDAAAGRDRGEQGFRTMAEYFARAAQSIGERRQSGLGGPDPLLAQGIDPFSARGLRDQMSYWNGKRIDAENSARGHYEMARIAREAGNLDDVAWYSTLAASSSADAAKYAKRAKQAAGYYHDKKAEEEAESTNTTPPPADDDSGPSAQNDSDSGTDDGDDSTNYDPDPDESVAYPVPDSIDMSDAQFWAILAAFGLLDDLLDRLDPNFGLINPGEGNDNHLVDEIPNRDRQDSIDPWINPGAEPTGDSGNVPESLQPDTPFDNFGGTVDPEYDSTTSNYTIDWDGTVRDGDKNDKKD